MKADIVPVFVKSMCVRDDVFAIGYINIDAEDGKLNTVLEPYIVVPANHILLNSFVNGINIL